MPDMADHEREIKLLAGTPESLEELARIPDLAGFRFGPTTMPIFLIPASIRSSIQ